MSQSMYRYKKKKKKKNGRLPIVSRITATHGGSVERLSGKDPAGSGDENEEDGSTKTKPGIKPPLTEEVIQSLLEKAKFYTSLCLGTTAIVSMFAFLFLIPFVVDPAISTIVADYDPDPVTCIATDHVYAEGLRNCSWSSCREGCTNAATRCHQILVNYSRTKWTSFAGDVDALVWDVGDTRFLVNTEGCGYPPRVNCSEFAKAYGYDKLGIPFPCYYSRTYPEMVVARYSWDDNLRHLVLSLIIPNVLFAVSIGVLSYWYCACCDRACQRSTRVYAEKFPPKEELTTAI